MKDLFDDIFRNLVSTKSARIAVLSLLLSAAALSFVLIIFGYNYTSDGVHAAPLPIWLKAVLAGGFVFSFILIWFLLYIQISKEADDLYSNIRSMLKGNWVVRYDASNGVPRDPLIPGLQVDCDIHINPENKKLEMEFLVEDNSIYESEKQVVNTVALAHDGGNQYSMFYYFNGKRKIKGQLWRYLIEDGDFSRSEGIDVEFFGVLHFQRSLTDKKVVVMDGEWFDLNGKVTQLFSLVDEVRKNENQQAKHLSDASIHSANFVAKMGKIEYKRRV